MLYGLSRLFDTGNFEFNTHLYTKYKSKTFLNAYLNVDDLEYSSNVIVSGSLLI